MVGCAENVDSCEPLPYHIEGMRVILICLLLTLSAVAHASDLLTFGSAQLAGRWHCVQSPWYRSMAEAVDQRGGYTLAPKHPKPAVDFIAEKARNAAAGE